MANVDLFLLII